MNVQYYPTSDTEQAQLFKCCTLLQNILTPPSHCSQCAEVKQSYWLVNITDERKRQCSCQCIVLISPFSAYAFGNVAPTMTQMSWYKHSSTSVGNTHLLFHLLHLKFIKIHLHRCSHITLQVSNQNICSLPY